MFMIRALPSINEKKTGLETDRTIVLHSTMIFNGFFRTVDWITNVRWNYVKLKLTEVCRRNVKTRASFSHKGFVCDRFWLYLAFLDGSTRFNSTRIRNIEFSIFVDARHIIKKKKEREKRIVEGIKLQKIRSEDFRSNLGLYERN